jgi:hypothetical protein
MKSPPASEISTAPASTDLTVRHGAPRSRHTGPSCNRQAQRRASDKTAGDRFILRNLRSPGAPGCLSYYPLNANLRNDLSRLRICLISFSNIGVMYW